VTQNACKLYIYKGENSIMNSTEAETKTREYIKQQHRTLQYIAFKSMYKERDVWVLEGTVEYKRAFLFTATKEFIAQVNMNTGRVTAYKTQPQRNKR
jgi:hypothetical protein